MAKCSVMTAFLACRKSFSAGAIAALFRVLAARIFSSRSADLGATSINPPSFVELIIRRIGGVFPPRDGEGYIVVSN